MLPTQARPILYTLLSDDVDLARVYVDTLKSRVHILNSVFLRANPNDIGYFVTSVQSLQPDTAMAFIANLPTEIAAAIYTALPIDVLLPIARKLGNYVTLPQAISDRATELVEHMLPTQQKYRALIRDLHPLPSPNILAFFDHLSVYDILKDRLASTESSILNKNNIFRALVARRNFSPHELETALRQACPFRDHSFILKELTLDTLALLPPFNYNLLPCTSASFWRAPIPDDAIILTMAINSYPAKLIDFLSRLADKSYIVALFCHLNVRGTEDPLPRAFITRTATCEHLPVFVKNVLSDEQDPNLLVLHITSELGLTGLTQRLLQERERFMQGAHLQARRRL